jgi:hypothetical protein
MARTRFGRAGGDAWPAAQVTTYVTAASTDPLFIPGNQAEGDNPASGSVAQRLADCQNLVGNRDDSNQSGTLISLAVRPKTLANW